MSKFQQNIISENGVVLWLPPNVQTESLMQTTVPPHIRVEDTSQRFPIGTRLTMDDRAFRYSFAESAAISHQNRGAGNSNRHMEGEAIGAAVAGAYTLDWRIEDCDFSTAEGYSGLDLVAYNVVNTYEGGYIWIMNTDVTKWEFHKIVSSLVATGTTTPASHYVRLTLETPLLSSTSDPWCTAYRNIYSDVRMEYPTYPSYFMPVVCVPHIKAAAGSYFWGQTWGPMWTTAHNVTPGLLAYDREVIFYGSVIAVRREFDPTTYSYQRAGYIITYTRNTGDMCYLLQLAP